MSKVFLSARRQPLLTSLLLALLLFRAYIPIGFMPASGAPFLLELCPAAAPMPMSMPMTGHHHHHSDRDIGHNAFQNCPFGSTPAAGPLAHRLDVAPPAPIISLTALAVESARISERIDRAHPPRGPPALT